MAARKPQSKRKVDNPSADGRQHGAAGLAGKVAVVTGGNRRIGFAIARALAAEGCSVVIAGCDRVTRQNAPY